MSTISEQHPAVVLRSRYRNLRALLAVAMIAVVSLAAAVVVLAVDEDSSGTVTLQPVSAQPQTAGPEVRYDGGPEEGTRGPSAAPTSPDVRYDGGPEEGTRGPGN